MILSFLWHFTRCGEFPEGLMCLIVSSGNYTYLEILTGNRIIRV